MAEIIRDVVVKLRIQQEDVKLKVPDSKPITDEVKKVKDSFGKAFEGVDKSIEDIEKGLDEVADTFKKLDKERSEAQEKLTAANIKVNESFVQAGDGAFTLARGLTLLGVSGEDDLGKVVKELAKVQAGFDIFKGSTQVIKGITEGVAALKVAMGAASLTGGSLLAVLGPLGIAAAVGGLILLMRDWGKASKEETDAILDRNRKLEENLRKTLELQKEIAGIRNDAAGRLFEAEIAALSPEDQRAARFSRGAGRQGEIGTQLFSAAEQQKRLNFDAFQGSIESNLSLKVGLLQEEIDRREKRIGGFQDSERQLSTARQFDLSSIAANERELEQRQQRLQQGGLRADERKQLEQEIAALTKQIQQQQEEDDRTLGLIREFVNAQTRLQENQTRQQRYLQELEDELSDIRAAREAEAN